MLWLLAALSAVAVAFVPLAFPGPPSLAHAGTDVVGGRPARPGEYPWQAALRTEGGRTFCGGVVLAPTWVLTAAHCTETETVDVVAGANNLALSNEEGRQVRRVKAVHTHPDYGRPAGGHDMALVELAQPFTLGDYVQPIRLAPNGWLSVGAVAVATGWGATAEGGPMTNVLQTVDLPLVGDAACRAAQGNIPSDQFCAGPRQGGQDTCAGDSGGPLALRRGNAWRLAGIVSWGFGCARPGYYGVYTRALDYRQWMQSVVGGDIAGLEVGPEGPTGPARNNNALYLPSIAAQTSAPP